jgi:hypothetical protein
MSIVRVQCCLSLQTLLTYMSALSLCLLYLPVICNLKFWPVKIFLINDLQTTFNTQFIYTYIIPLHNKFHVPKYEILNNYQTLYSNGTFLFS